MCRELHDDFDAPAKVSRYLMPPLSQAYMIRSSAVSTISLHVGDSQMSDGYERAIP
jgi:hypothetical protein